MLVSLVPLGIPLKLKGILFDAIAAWKVDVDQTRW